MKIIGFILLFSSITTFSFSQTTKQQDIDQLLISLNVKSSIEKIALQGIEFYKKQKPAVPQKVWSEIVNSIDYKPYINKVISIFDDNYTHQEIKHLIELSAQAKSGTIPKFTATTKEQLYTASNEFGKQFAEFLFQQLRIKGY